MYCRLLENISVVAIQKRSDLSNIRIFIGFPAKDDSISEIVDFVNCWGAFVVKVHRAGQNNKTENNPCGHCYSSRTIDEKGEWRLW